LRGALASLPHAKAGEAIPIKFRDCRTCLWQVRNDREEKIADSLESEKPKAQNVKL